MIGSSIAHYRITAKIGEGGMGEVYLATDERLGREVAIKLLPSAVEKDAKRLARFRRGAQVLASLNHPNIGQIYGLEEQDGRNALVLELIEGDTLAEAVARGPVAPDAAIRIALQIAEALEAAHEKGIVHRDLKPANVKITPNDTVKVLDFGLAKALAAESASSSGINLAASPTVTSAQTVDGVILGTAAYMSPEQARGKEVDKRADIWAFGCVLFELLTARTIFAGDTVSDTLVGVLSGDPDWDALPEATPAKVRRLLERCLTRDVRRRLRDIGEARVMLEDAVGGEVEAPVAPAAPRPVSPMRWVVLAVVGVLLFAAGWLLKPSNPVTGAIPSDRSVRRLTFESGLEQEPTLSPDGNYVAYTTDRAGNLDIEILPLGEGNVTRITDHPADDAQPRWSPDGTRLAFVSARERPDGLLVSSGFLGASSPYVNSEGGDIFLMPAFGGAATKLIDDATYPTWSPDGRDIAFLSTRDGNWRIWRVPVTGGEPQQLTQGENSRFDYHPAWSPDGNWIAYASLFAVGEEGLYVVPAGGGEPIQLFEGNAVSPAWSPDGHHLYFSSSRNASPGLLNLWRIPFDPKGNLSVRPERVTLGVDSDAYAAPAEGRIAFATVRFSPDLWSLDVSSGELHQVTSLEGMEDSPNLNVDGRRLLFDGDRTGILQIWVLDLEDGNLRQVVTPGRAGQGSWSPDGSFLAYQLSTDTSNSNVLDGSSSNRVAIQRWGDANAELIDGDAGRASTGLQWSPDGRQLAGGDANDVWVHTRGGESKILIEDAQFPTWSPDGTEIAFQRNAGQDHREIWIVPVAGGEPRMVAGGEAHYSHPKWHPADPDRIMFVIDHQDLGMVRVSTGEVERITDLASSTSLVDYPSWSPDGRKIFFSFARKRGDLYLIEDTKG
jgi:Tol biopolymer transport system component/serine/threonine protein kinase